MKNSQAIEARRAIIRCVHQGKVRYGLWETGELRLYQGSPFSGARPGNETADLDLVRLLAPCRPSKVVAVGLNYKAHAAEMNKPLPATPLIFLKPSTAVIGPREDILVPSVSQRVDHESELGVVIGRTCRQVAEKDALSYVLGYTCLNDVTARDLQKLDIQYTRAKGFDTFCPLGPAISLDTDPHAVAVNALVDGQVRQQGHTSDLIFPVERLVSFISRIMTLGPGDVIATGTPSGVGPILPGQEVVIRIEGIGSLLNPVKKRRD